MRLGVHYNHTYAPVADWYSIIILLNAVLSNNWKMLQLDYVFALPQALVLGCVISRFQKVLEYRVKPSW